MLGLVASFLLLGIYGAMESHWPSTYVSPTTAAGQLGRFSLAWFLLFRMGPAALVSGIVAVTAERLDADPKAAIATTLAPFVLFGYVFLLRRARQSTHRLKIVLAGTVGALLSLLGGVLGGFVLPLLDFLIPQPTELLNAIWTAIVAAAAYFAVSRLSRKEDARDLGFSRTRRDIGPEAWAYAKETSAARGVYPNAVHAILLAEAMQRPRWFRRLEIATQRIRSRFGNSGTTGVAQMRSKAPLSDTESIDLLIGDIVRWSSAQSGALLGDHKSFESYLRRHNDDTVFVESALHFFAMLQSADV